MGTFGEIALNNGKCCICGKKLWKPGIKGHFSSIQIYKKATWDKPSVSLITQTGQRYDNFAMAIICAECDNVFGGDIKELQNMVRFAVELDLHNKNIVYHDVTKLEDYPLVIEG